MKVNDKLIRVYVSEEIKDHVKEKSKEAGLSESAWVRLLIIKDAAKVLRRDKRKEG